MDHGIYLAAANSKAYFTFRPNQVGSPSGTTYVQDPWANSYGYYTGDGTANTSSPNSGAGFFDLWSTGGSKTATNFWIMNWK